MLIVYLPSVFTELFPIQAMPLCDMAESKLSFRAHITPKRGRLLVTVVSPLMPAPLYRSYPAAMPQDAAVERAVGHAAASLTEGQQRPVQIRTTWQMAFL